MDVLGVDIGGSKIAAGRVNQRAEILSSVVLPTRAAEGYEVSLSQVYRAIEENFSPEPAAIGICSPGPLNPKTGVVVNPPNLPGWCNVPLADLVEQKFGRPCRVENDANAAGLAEARYGAARGHSNVLYVTLSTGIGTGIIVNGRIYHGKNGAAGEGGHVTIDYRSQVICNCGNVGCIEALASGSAIAQRGGAGILEETSTMLAAWLGSMISVLDPDIIVIGGGVARIGEPLFARLRELTPARTINRFADQTPIVPAALGENAGILGAAAVVL